MILEFPLVCYSFWRTISRQALFLHGSSSPLHCSAAEYPSTRKDECLVFLRGGAFTPAGRLLALSAPSSVVEGLERSLLNVQSHGIYNVFGQRLWFLHTHLVLIFGAQLFLHLFYYLPCTFLKMSKCAFREA